MKYSKPSWWVLYVLVVAIPTALVVESVWGGVPRQGVVQVVTLLVGFALVWLWLRANEGALAWGEYETKQRENRVRNFDALRPIRVRLPVIARREPREMFPPVSGFGAARRRKVVTIQVSRLDDERVRLHRQILYKRDY